MDYTRLMMEDFLAYSFDLDHSKNALEDDSSRKDRIIHIQTFLSEQIFGSYFSCIYKGELRIHIAFDKDTDEYNSELSSLVWQTIEETNICKGKIWISNDNTKIIEQIQTDFKASFESEPFLYESHEMGMTRENFHYKYDSESMEIKPYQEEHIDKYLLLLFDAMNFKIPAYNYLAKKDELGKEFSELSKKGFFETFWINDELVGLYWISGTEIDHLAVSEKYQHHGYAKQILTRAIDVLFQNPDIDYAWLLVVEWNSKAYSFYKKYGMEEKAVYHVPYKDTL